MKRKNKGITLIALVITIIVLLILAGVALSLVAGNEGILEKAETAVSETNEASAKEQAELLIADYLSEYYEEAYVNNNEAVKAQTVEAYIQGKITETGVASSAGDYFVTIGTDNKITVYKGTSVNESNKVAEGSLLLGGKVEWNNKTGQAATLSSQITTANYGDYVDLGTSLIVNDNIALEDGTYPTTDWRIFHKDSTGGVYLILADYLPYSYEAIVGSGLTNDGSSYPYNWKSSTSRIDLINRLKNKTAWNNLIDSTYTAKGISVTGTIDLETWVESWNANDGYTQLTTNKWSNENGSVQSDGLDGYYIGTAENSTTTYVSVSKENTLYFPHTIDLLNNRGYLLASPTANNTQYVAYVGTDGLVGFNRYAFNGDWRSVRPVVYLPSDITGEWNETKGVWEI